MKGEAQRGQRHREGDHAGAALAQRARQAGRRRDQASQEQQGDFRAKIGADIRPIGVKDAQAAVNRHGDRGDDDDQHEGASPQIPPLRLAQLASRDGQDFPGPDLGYKAHRQAHGGKG